MKLHATGLDTFIADIGNVNLIARIHYPGVTTKNKNSETTLKTVWQRFDKEDNYLDDLTAIYEIVRNNDYVEIDSKGYFETEIKFSCSWVDQINTINCTFYSIEPDKDTQGQIIGYTEHNLGTKTLAISAVDNLTYRISTYNGDVLYKYDSDGDSPLVGKYDGPASSRINNIDPIGFRIFKPDGTELSEIEYMYCKYKWSFPKNSMMTLKGYTKEELENLPQDEKYYYIIGTGYFIYL